MIIKFSCVWAAWLLGLSAFGQTVGSTEEFVVNNFGVPQMERDQGARKIWIYSNGSRIVIANGVVVEANVAAQAALPLAQRSPEEVDPAPVRPVRPPENVRPRPSAEMERPQPRSNPVSGFGRGQSDLSPLVIVLGLLSLVIAVVSGVWYIVITFKESVLWGLGSLFLPGVSLVFTILHWQEAKAPFFIGVVSVGLMVSALVAGVT